MVSTPARFARSVQDTFRWSVPSSALLRARLLRRVRAVCFAGPCDLLRWSVLSRSLVGAVVTTNELVRLLQADGWTVVRQKGSHAMLRHPTKAGQLTVAIQ